MKMLLLCGLTATAVLLAALPAAAIVWAEVELEVDQPELALVVAPDRSGPPMISAQLHGGAPAGRPLRVRLWVCGESPCIAVPNFPGEDIWLEGPALLVCPGGTNPDGPTDADGWATWSGPLAAGGHSLPQQPLFVYVMGAPAYLHDAPEWVEAEVPLRLLGVDIDGNQWSNLADLTLFTTAFMGAFDPRVDYSWDGTLNLADLSYFAASFGTGPCD